MEIKKILGIGVIVCAVMAIIGTFFPFGSAVVNSAVNVELTTMIVYFFQLQTIATAPGASLGLSTESLTWIEVGQQFNQEVLAMLPLIFGIIIIIFAVIAAVLGLVQVLKTEKTLIPKLSLIFGILLIVLTLVEAFLPAYAIFAVGVQGLLPDAKLASLLPGVGTILILIPAILIIVLSIVAMIKK